MLNLKDDGLCLLICYSKISQKLFWSSRVNFYNSLPSRKKTKTKISCMRAIVSLPLRTVFWTIFINHIQICGTIFALAFHLNCQYWQLLQYYHGFYQPSRGCHLIAESRPQCPSIICSIDLALTSFLVSQWCQ